VWLLSYSYPSFSLVVDDVFAHLPTILSIAVPCLLPPGIMGATLMGLNGMIAILRNLYYCDPWYTAWINDPLTIAWLMAVAASPSLFAINTTEYKDLQSTVSDLHLSTLPCASPWLEDLWWGKERTLCCRLLLDIVIQFMGYNKHLSHAFLGYLKEASAP
jgi:hypothetical protein